MQGLSVRRFQGAEARLRVVIGPVDLQVGAALDRKFKSIGVALDAAGGAVVPEVGATCCYAKSDKAWTEDPQGTKWETFHTTGEATTYYAPDSSCATEAAACAPAAVQA